MLWKNTAWAKPYSCISFNWVGGIGSLGAEMQSSRAVGKNKMAIDSIQFSVLISKYFSSILDSIVIYIRMFAVVPIYICWMWLPPGVVVPFVLESDHG